MANITGKVLGSYKVTGYLRDARMGDVYIARHTETDERVCLKLLDSALFHDPEAVRRFERETRIAREIAHPNTLKVMDWGRSEDGLPFLVTEFADGDTLAEVIEDEGALRPERAAWLACQVALGLQAAHDKGIIHRDLSPDTILLADTDDGGDIVKITDFSLARQDSANDSSGGLTAVGVRVGTPYYMAPEYIEEFDLDHRADLYALGIVLFEMLTGKPPFTGRPYQVLSMHVDEEAPAPSSQNPKVPAWLDAVVAGLLQKAPDDRTSTAADVAAAIQAGLGLG